MTDDICSRLASREVEVLRHALGLNNPKAVGTRNHFAADQGGDDDNLWRGLVEKGLATGPRTKPSIFDTLNFYYVTDAGREAVLSSQEGAHDA